MSRPQLKVDQRQLTRPLGGQLTVDEAGAKVLERDARRAIRGVSPVEKCNTNPDAKRQRHCLQHKILRLHTLRHDHLAAEVVQRPTTELTKGQATCQLGISVAAHERGRNVPQRSNKSEVNALPDRVQDCEHPRLSPVALAGILAQAHEPLKERLMRDALCAVLQLHSAQMLQERVGPLATPWPMAKDRLLQEAHANRTVVAIPISAYPTPAIITHTL
eukprot:CAMPEP_0171262050 /NCGR_PEP_ID=MMETSP0790-20130122/56336_1 /TAXON_ID=2925 /ORGANISM="Alexandrium catenella, Strain OF101" /LENGTH=217 /DNA_ID=CAMNT_0011730529 /DNA_START=111 /DNA_END=764 /DNA_ORIENTATION=+